MVNSSSKIKTIQLLRAVAVLLVVHCHVLDLQTDNSLQQHFFYLQNFGSAGVDIFFVISGFIICIISLPYARNKEFIRFFIKRLIRVLPVYWLGSLLFLILYYFHNHVLVETKSIIKTIVLLPFFDNPRYVDPILLQGWTLSFELLFYMIVTLAMIFSRKRYMLICGLFFLTAISLNYATGHHNHALNFIGNAIMLEFLLGVIAGCIFLSEVKISPVLVISMVIAGIAGFLATIIFGNRDVSEAGNLLDGSLSELRSMIWGVPSFFLVLGLVMKEKIRPVKIPPVWMAIGDASFSIYLTHILIIGSLYVRWQSWGLQGKIQPDIQIIISMAITVAGGYFFYRLVELPLLRHLDGYINRTEKPVNNIYSS